MDLASLIHRLATDEQFAVQLKDDPEGTLHLSDLTIDAESLQALKNILCGCVSFKSLVKDSQSEPDEPWNWAIGGLKETAYQKLVP